MDNKVLWQDFLEKIADYTGMDKSGINESTNIYDDLGMDSLGLFSLGMFLIKTYKRKIPLSAVASIQTVNDIFILMNHEQDPQPQ